jgi:hypothetical protein
MYQIPAAANQHMIHQSPPPMRHMSPKPPLVVPRFVIPKTTVVPVDKKRILNTIIDKVREISMIIEHGKSLNDFQTDIKHINNTIIANHIKYVDIAFSEISENIFRSMGIIFDLFPLPGINIPHILPGGTVIRRPPVIVPLNTTPIPISPKACIQRQGSNSMFPVYVPLPPQTVNPQPLVIIANKSDQETRKATLTTFLPNNTKVNLQLTTCDNYHHGIVPPKITETGIVPVSPRAGIKLTHGHQIPGTVSPPSPPVINTNKTTQVLLPTHKVSPTIKPKSPTPIPNPTIQGGTYSPIFRAIPGIGDGMKPEHRRAMYTALTRGGFR